MSDIAIEMTHVHKKFKKGEIYNSLRDLIPALASKIMKNGSRNALQEREFWALQDVSFQVRRGESLGIIGPNGAGKSTILKLLSRIMKPTKGYLMVNGTLSALIEVGAGFHQDLTGRENIYLNGTILGMKKREIEKKFDEIVDFSGISEFIDTPVKRYSSGMYARLGFSVAAHVDPEILLVDEVLSVGDYSFQNKCMMKMNSILEGGSTVIFISHNLRAVAQLCRRGILLDNGKIIQEGAASEVVNYYMNSGQGGQEVAATKDVYISRVSIRGETGTGLQFCTGQRVFFEMDITANVDCKKLSSTLYLTDENHYEIFSTSTERLNLSPFYIKAGETKKVIYEIYLHLAPAEYHVCAHIYRYDIQKMYDSRVPAIKIFVKSDIDIGGVVNLYPKVVIE